MEEILGEPAGSRCRRVLLFPLPLQGHINPMLQLATILHSKGFCITILHTPFNSPDPSNFPHFTFRPVLDDDNLRANEKIAKLASEGVGNLLSRIMLLNQYGADCFRYELEQVISVAEKEEPIACLITDAIWHFTQSVADSLNLHRLVLRTSSLFCFLVYASLPFLDVRGYLNHAKSIFDEARTAADEENNKNLGKSSGKEGRSLKSVEGSISVLDLEDPVPEFRGLKVKDISKIGIKSHTEPLAELLANAVKQAKASSGIIWNSFKELEEPELQMILQDFPVPNFLIGPFHKYFSASSSSLLEQDRRSLAWLDTQASKSVLYVSFGSIAQLDGNDFLEIAYGLANSKQSFLWVVRPGSVKGSEWIERLPNGFLDLVGEKGLIVKWAPQQEILAHPATGAFWTHNGWNSTMESICEGIPMICSPFWGDQSLDARYVSDVRRVGVYLENGWAREEITSAIRRVMVDEEGKEIRDRARSLKETVNLCLNKGGSSYESLKSLIDHISSF